ncbi:hypothetical protein J4573_39375 [Actinomadura barringtoniae]|uniref:Uncharacterized protein n=1 Tax=Actinomadura barringtoniae TaxID=1427535 RepID=A0A939PIE5_9ACTN|nr:hypothetical protein [Actinomadura barringtoniae]MBO2453210.1 hypothetical protein [Actinomadura barringtoniae]
MTPARALVRMYPAAFREQWGPDLEAEIVMAGWRSWPNTLLGIADMWLHPALWPAGSHAQRRLRITTSAISLTALCWFVGHVGLETDTGLSRAAGHSLPLSAGLILMVAGLVLIAPLPRPSVAGLLALARAAAAAYTLPASMGMVAVAAVHLGVDGQAPLLLRGILLAGWWTALAVGALRTCRIPAELGARFVIPPRPGRLRLGTWVLITGAGIEAATLLGSTITHPELPALGFSAAVLAVIPAFVPVLRACR